MARTFPQLLDFLAETLKADPATIGNIIRRCREAGLITRGKRGRGAPKVVTEDAIKALIALLSTDSPANAPDALRQAQALVHEQRPPGLDLRMPGVREAEERARSILHLPPGRLTLLEALVAIAPDWNGDRVFKLRLSRIHDEAIISVQRKPLGGEWLDLPFQSGEDEPVVRITAEVKGDVFYQLFNWLAEVDDEPSTRE